MVAPAAAAQLEDGITFLGPARVNDMHCGRGPAQQLRNLHRAGAQGGSDENALDALVLRVRLRVLEPLGQSADGGLVADDQTLHPRLRMLRGWKLYLIY